MTCFITSDIFVYFCSFFFFSLFTNMLPLSVYNVHCIIHCVCLLHIVYGAWGYLFAAGLVYMVFLGVHDLSPINVYFSLGGGILWTISL